MAFGTSSTIKTFPATGHDSPVATSNQAFAIVKIGAYGYCAVTRKCWKIHFWKNPPMMILFESGTRWQARRIWRGLWQWTCQKMHPGKIILVNLQVPQSISKSWIRDLPKTFSFWRQICFKAYLEAIPLWQSQALDPVGRRKDIGEIIIGNLSSAGYLAAGIDRNCGNCQINARKCSKSPCPHPQNFDPVGIAARDARECLLIQIKNFKLWSGSGPGWIDSIPPGRSGRPKRYKPLLRKFKMGDGRLTRISWYY